MMTNWLDNFAAGLTEKDCMEKGTVIYIDDSDIMIGDKGMIRKKIVMDRD